MIVELVSDEAIDIIKNSKKLVNSHKYLDAIELLENGLENHPENQKLLYNLGKKLFQGKQLQQGSTNPCPGILKKIKRINLHFM